MYKNRRAWKLWPKRFKEALNGTSGVSGVGGIIISLAGLTVSSPLNSIIIIFGGIIALLSFIWSAWQSIPMKYISHAESVGQSFTLRELDRLYPPIKKIAVIGMRGTGKTTLKSRLAHQNGNHQRTQVLTTQIITVPDSPPKYIGVIDGAGERFNHQFDSAKYADYLYLIIDHNFSDSNIELSKSRLKENLLFHEQIRNTLSDENGAKKKWIEILINKRDLWEKMSIADKNEFETYCSNELIRWKNSNLAEKVVIHAHSNEKPDDVARLMEELRITLRN